MLSSLSRRLTLLFAGLMLVAFGFALGSSILPSAAGSLPSAVLLDTPIQQIQTDLSTLDLTQEEQHIASVYNAVSPSVVSINVTIQGSDSGFSDEFGFGSGSGFVISTEGYIVTNNHVVDNATADGIEVNFVDGTIVRGELVGVDPDSDLAVIKVNLPPEHLPPLTLANSDNLVIGQTALAVGSPFGQRWTLTKGIVSAIDRTIQGLTQFSIGSVIQTDAAINPGNSGGPLFNLKGEVIGVNSQIVSQFRTNSGVGFAIPSNLVSRVANEIIQNGHVEYSYLGINGGLDMDLLLIETMGLPNNLRGVVVSNVLPNGPAGRAGLRNPGGDVTVRGLRLPSSADIITQIDGVPVMGMNELVSYLASNTRPGDTVNLTVWREGQQIVLPVELSARPQ